MAAADLTPGCIPKIYESEKLHEKPVVQITSLRRYLSPVETNGGPIISHVLQRILQTDAALASRLHSWRQAQTDSVADSPS